MIDRDVARWNDRLPFNVTLCAWCILVGVGVGSSAFAKLLTFDEFGNSSIGQATRKADPGPGGQSSVLTYVLPFSGVQGDVVLTENGDGEDLLRFNGDGTLLFYSSNLNGTPAPADGPAPDSLYPNPVLIPEVGSAGNDGAVYTPSPGQPGYDVSGPSYRFISDGSFATTTPAPAMGTWGLMGLTVLLLGIGARHLRAAKAS